MKGTFVSVEGIIGRTMASLGYTGPENEALCESWAMTAMLSIGIMYVNEWEKEFEISNWMFDKPKGFIDAKAIQLKTASGDCFNPNFGSIHGFQRLVCSCQKTCQCGQAAVYENVKTINVSTERLYTSAIMSYYSVPVDSNGDYLIPYYAEEAIECYLKWKLLEMRHDIGTERTVSFARVKEEERRYLIKRRKASSLVVTPNIAALPGIAANWLRLSSPYHSAQKLYTIPQY